MSRQARRRAEREARKLPDPNSTIILKNPVSQHFAAFAFGNATKCDRVVTKDSAKGQHLILCGAGPSLAEEAAEWCPQGDQVWGCNSAAIWLQDNGYPVTHAFTVDQTAHMVAEWESSPDLTYLLASTVHPHLSDYLLSMGRSVTWFHNYVGIVGPPVSYAVCQDCGHMGDADVAACPECESVDLESATLAYEDWLYSALYPGTIRAGSGLNSVTRAIDVALYTGFDRITVLGADCALRVKAPPPNAPHGSPEHLRWLREETIMHADGGHALASEASALTMGAEIDGRWWETKPDMAISASWLVRMEQYYPQVELVGDTLPNAIKGKPEEFLSRLPHMTDANGNPLKIHFDTTAITG